MNRVYQVIWNRSKGVWQAASELTHSSRGSSSGTGSVAGSLKTISAGAILLIALPLHASDLPSGGTVIGGQGSINSSGKTLTVNQSSQNMAINWQDFSIAEGHTVNFNQPNAQAAALNRVTGNNVSDIRGALNANGRVFLVNPNGVMFSSTARVDVGSLITSTLDISTEDFMAGNYRFEGASANAIINQGNITTAEGGVVAMIAAEIINTGNITTPKGSTLMGAGSKVTLDLGGPVKIEVEEALLDTYIEQGGAIRANGGLVYLTAKSAGELASSVINHTGVTEARTLATGEDGRIMLMGDMNSGQVQVAGTLDASAPNGGDGGFIETSAAKVSILDEVTVTTKAESGQTGEWLIDPNDYTIAASGGDITGSKLSTILESSSIYIESAYGSETNGNGDIFVNDQISWNSGNTLGLSAIRNIEINSTLDASGGSGGKLVLEYGQGAATSGNTATYNINAPVNLQAGQNFSTRLGNDGAVIDYTVITELGAEGSITGTDLQGINGNLSGNYALGSDIDASETSGWNNGAGWNPIGDWFSGNFDGLGHTIDSIHIDRPTEIYVGFFGDISEANISNLGIINAEIKAKSYAGILAGGIGNSTVSNVFSSGSVSLVDPWGYVAGGLLGFVSDSSISQSHSSASVSGKDNIGGLVGELTRSSIENSYAIGSATGVRNEDEASYKVGGLVGLMEQSSIKNSYATGAVSGDFAAGGLVGHKGSSDSVENSYWDIDTSGQTISAGGEGKTTAEMYSQSTYMNWDAAIWSYAVGQAADGYEVGLPSLINVTRIEDRPTTTLFEGGMGTAGNAYTITNWNQLQNINYSTDVLRGGYHFVLSNDLAKNTTGYSDQASSTANSGAGWAPLGNDNNDNGTSGFLGVLDGAGHTLDGLYINRSSADHIGLFGATDASANLTGIRLTNADVTGQNWVGSLVGRSRGTIADSSATGVTVTGAGAVGAFGGDNYGTVETSYSTGSVTGKSNVGGLFGYSKGSVSNSYTLADVTATGGGSDIGGLVGENNSAGGSITNAYAANTISGGGTNMGGLVGNNSGTVTHAYYDKTINSGQSDENTYGKTTTEMQTATTFSGWDLATSGGSSKVWRLYEGQSSPLLRSFMTVATVSSGNADTLSKTYDGTTAFDQKLLELNWQVADNSAFNSDLLLGSGFRLDNENVGTRNLVGGYHSGQQGYDIVVDSNLGKRQVEVTAAKKPTDDNPTEDNPALDNAIQSAQQTASPSGNPITGSFGSAAGMTDISLSGGTQSGGLEVVELDSNSSNTIIEGQSSQGIGPLQMFVIDGGISVAEDS